MVEQGAIIPIGKIEQRILLIRGEKVVIDADLAEFFGVSSKVLNQAVKRNRLRFPEEFMFQLSSLERKEVVTNCDHLAKLKYSRHPPFAFTEHGAIMAANLLNSPRAVSVSVFIVRAFVHLRRTLTDSKELNSKLADLEGRLTDHDEHILSLMEAIRELASPQPIPPKRRIGFTES